MRTYVDQKKVQANISGARALNKPVGYGFANGERLVAFIATDRETGAVKRDKHGTPAINWRPSDR